MYALIPTGDTEQQLNSHYEGGALDTYGADVGYQINDKTKVSVGYHYQNGDVMEADGGGVSAGLNYDITNNLTAGLKVSYDDTFETRVMATINWSFADLIKRDEAEKEATTNRVMKAFNTSPEQRDVRVHDGCIAGLKCPPIYGGPTSWAAAPCTNAFGIGCCDYYSTCPDVSRYVIDQYGGKQCPIVPCPHKPGSGY